MADDLVDLNPVPTKVDSKKKKQRPIESPPDDGPLIITLYAIVLRGGTESFTRSRFSREISIPIAQTFITHSTRETPTILAGALHGIIINYLGHLAADTIAKIVSGDGEVTEHSLIGDAHADYKVSYIPQKFHTFMSV
jgi:hypothetical protein